MSKAEELADALDAMRIDPALCHHMVVPEVEAAAAELRRLAALEKAIMDAEPVAWMRDDGQDGSISTMTNCCSAKVKDLWLKANPIQVQRYTIPLYTLNGIKKP